ncbi:hypothetical protein O0555_05585 [Brevibacillus laterosporus]|nr:hypothetical protein [Brevibacillus laterosporus]MBM7107328.1 hypothetical protein [Brevibacillus laterosporus]MCR8936822.1 hypothetical protein [Brevibacillus laterosporus]MCR8981368.1 hypothetical protein [Brevibacillus laterosporus]MCZ0839461.1 hypothetical protein [Brevibacillus laterosporus]MCZ0845421.1 hypothetical protein [Brevibacillus laterosporus]
MMKGFLLSLVMAFGVFSQAADVEVAKVEHTVTPYEHGVGG